MMETQTALCLSLKTEKLDDNFNETREKNRGSDDSSHTVTPDISLNADDTSSNCSPNASLPVNLTNKPNAFSFKDVNKPSSDDDLVSDSAPGVGIPVSGLPTMIPMNLSTSDVWNLSTKASTEPSYITTTATTTNSTASRPASALTYNNNKPKSTKSGSKKSFVWRYFEHPRASEDSDPDKTRTQCLLCKSQLAFNASGTTTTMLNHLKSRHSEIAETEEQRRRLNKLPVSTPGTTPSINSTSTTGGKSNSESKNPMFLGGDTSKSTDANNDSGILDLKANRKKATKTPNKPVPHKQDTTGRTSSPHLLGDNLKIPSSTTNGSNHLLNQHHHLSHLFSNQSAAHFESLGLPHFPLTSSGKINGLSLTNFLPPNQLLQFASQVPNPPTSDTNNEDASNLQDKKSPKSPGKRKRAKPMQIPPTHGKRPCSGDETVDFHSASGGVSNMEEWTANSTNQSSVNAVSRSNAQMLSLPTANSSNFYSSYDHLFGAQPATSAVQSQQINSSRVSEALAYFLVKDLFPVSILGGTGFQSLMKELAPSLPSPSVELMRRETLPFIYKRTKAKVMEELRLSEVTGAALSLEIWSREHKHYASIKVHYLDNTMKEMKSKLLKTKEINAQVLCSKLLQDSYIQLGLTNAPRRCPVVVNNPEPLLDELYNAGVLDTNEQFQVIPCLVSCLAEALKAGFSVTSVASLVTRCRVLIEDSDVEVGSQESWLSAYTLLRRVQASYSDIKQRYRDSISYSDALLTAEEEALLQKLIPVIESINQTLDTIGNGSLFMTASMIKPIICNLRKNQLCVHNNTNSTANAGEMLTSLPAGQCSPSSTDSISANDSPSNGDAVSEFKGAIWQHLCQYYEESGPVNDTLWIATLVDPRFKRSYESHATSFERSRILRRLKEEVGETDCNSDADRVEDSANLQQVFGHELFSPSSRSEVDRYLLESPIQLKENPLQWWSANWFHFPRVAAVAKRYLCIPVTSVSTNNIYGSSDSASASLATKRAQIDPEDLDTYLFLSHNWQL